jgi:hypothetical protein
MCTEKQHKTVLTASKMSQMHSHIVVVCGWQGGCGQVEEKLLVSTFPSEQFSVQCLYSSTRT